ncbi:DJ-1/PfpI family protein [Crepidotus variabilis]|uniref:DJ-1/PfpI family protein n=1 Tax=Crepidotus variabilis TaxID=179855 RepID=A0A9P6E8D1_9AGAR|nr:DJ-1/PfpI family protein [Crepidotus variabilis]
MSATPLSMAAPQSFPMRYGVLLYPGFQALDVFGPLDVFTSLSQFHPLHLSIISKTMDPIPTKLGASQNGSQFAQSVLPTHTFENAPPLDILLVPGGLGNRPPSDMEPYILYIQAVYPDLKYLLTVCTGSYLAARTGILDGKRATTNKKAFREIATAYPKVNWVAQARWVADENIWTSSGVAAGMDLALSFIAKVYGDDLATSISDSLEYERHEDADWDPFATRHGLV